MQQNKPCCINDVQKYLKKRLQTNATYAILISATKRNKEKLICRNIERRRK